MTNFIPIFPLGIVVYPGEQLNLHIFEPRYKQLITESAASGKPFGIPAVINENLAEMGTLVRVLEISHLYEDGKMDVKTEGILVFKMLELVREIPEKLYSGAIVSYPDNDFAGSRAMMNMLVKGMYQIHEKLGVSKTFSKPDTEMTSYDIAHHLGLTIEEEYRVLELLLELHRQEFLKRHLAKVVPMMEEMEMLKKKIKKNGHFKNLEGFKFS